MSRRSILKGIASGVVGSFVSRNNDLDGYWGIGMLCLYARNIRKTSVTINLCSNVEEQLIISTLAGNYCYMFKNITAKLKLNPHWVKKVEILIEFGTSNGNLIKAPYDTWGDPFQCTLSITDDLGHIWRASKIGRCVPHDPKRESRSTRADGF